MEKLRYILFLVLSLFLLPVKGQVLDNFRPGNVSSTYSSRIALVIGNSAYKDSPLKNPANDAKAITIELKRAGFEVISYTDLDRKGMRDAIHEFGDKLNASKGVGLFYYAGHGLQSQGANYLVPVNADITKEYDIEDECVKADLVLRMMELYENPMNIIILDACRNNPYARSFRSMDRGLAQPDSAPIGTIIAFATAPGKTASDGDGDNGLYTQELIKAIRIPGLTIERLFKQVRINVLQKSNREQSPWENSSLTGDFYFYPEGADPLLVSNDNHEVIEKTSAKKYSLKEIKFFEAGEELGENSYRSDFDKATARYIYTRISFKNHQYSNTEWTTNFKIKYFKPNGSLWTNLSSNEKIQTDWEDAYVQSGWGWPKEGFWSAGEYRVEVWEDNEKIGEEYFTITGETFANYEYNGLRFFEAGDEVEKKDFKERFGKYSSRYIWTELNLTNKKYNQSSWQTSYTVRYYKPDGSLFGEPTINSTISTDLDVFTVRTGWGWPDYGNWETGEYRVEVWDGDIKLGEDSFTIFDASSDDTASRNYFSNSPNYTFESIEFFESGDEVSARNLQREFRKSDARYIYTQVNFINKQYQQSKWTTDFLLKYYKPDGSFFGQISINVDISTEWDESYAHNGWGWPNAGNWELGKYRVEVWDGNTKLGENYFNITDQPSYNLTASNYDFLDIEFFEAGDKVAERITQKSFSKSSTRFIYTQVHIKNNRNQENSWTTNFTIKYFKPDGTLFGEPTINTEIKSEWSSPDVWTGWGWPNPGNWQLGVYRVEVWGGTNKLGEAKFTIY